MQDRAEDRPGPAGPSRGNEEAERAGWSVPKPATIPSPSYWPFFLSLGATLVGLGVLTSNLITAAGTVLFALAVIKWVGELSRERS